MDASVSLNAAKPATPAVKTPVSGAIAPKPPIFEPPKDSATISPQGQAAAVSGVGVPANDEPTTPGGLLRSKLNRMCEQSDSPVRLSKKFADKLDKPIKEGGVIDENGNVDLIKLRDYFLEDTGLKDDKFKKDSFLKLLGNGEEKISFTELKNRLNFYQQVLYARKQVNGEGFLQVMRKDEITYYDLADSAKNNIDLVTLGKTDKETYIKYLELAVRAIQTSNPTKEEMADISKNYEKWSKGEGEPPKAIKDLLFYVYHAAFESYSISNNIELDDVDFKDPEVSKKFLKGVFSEFVAEGALNKSSLKASSWNFLRSKENVKFFINNDVINKLNPYTINNPKAPNNIGVPDGPPARATP